MGLAARNGEEVRGPLSAGTLVAVQGAYELQDGMGVRTGPK